MNKLKWSVLILVLISVLLLTACGNVNFVSEKYAVTFNSNGGADVATQEVAKGGKIAEPQTPEREGFVFQGWYAGNDKWDFATDTVTQDLELKAKWADGEYTLTIKYYYMDSDLVLKQAFGTDVTVAVPQRDGYEFLGFSEAIPSKMPGKDMVIEAKWSAKQHALRIENYYGDSDYVANVPYNSQISLEAPTREGYTFTGYSAVLPGTMPDENVTLTANWTVNKYNLTLKNYYGSSDYVLCLDYNAVIIVPMPTKTGYTFDGWTVALPDTMPAGDIVTEPKWRINRYTLTIRNYYSNSDLVITQDYNTPIEVSYPSKPGYIFMGWADNKTVPSVMPAVNLEIEAIWMINDYVVVIKNYYGDTDLVISQDIGTPLDVPTPIREGYTFQGFSEAIPATMPMESKEIQTNWKINQYTLLLKNYYGTSDKEIKLNYGVKITEVVPARAGYSFDGWSQALPSNMPAKDLTLEAKWICDAKYRIEGDRAVITGLNNTVNPVLLEEYENCIVNAIDEWAFRNLSSLKSIVIPDTVLTIGQGAFYNCTGLKELVIPAFVASLENYAFFGCTSLTEITYAGIIAQWMKITKGSSWDGNMGDYRITCSDSDKNLVLVATYYENSRLSITDNSKAAAKAANQLVFVELGKSATAAGNEDNCIRMIFAGDCNQFSDLVGTPVSVNVVIQGNRYVATKVEALGASLTDKAGAFTSSGSKYYHNGAEILIDNVMFAWANNNSSSHAWVKSLSGAWVENTLSTRFFNNKSDEIYTFVDINGDGKYDWVREFCTVNGLAVNINGSTSGSKLRFTNGGVGSNDYISWWDSTVTYTGDVDFNSLKNGSRVNVRVHFNSDVSAHGTRLDGEIYAVLEASTARDVYGSLTKATSTSVLVEGIPFTWSTCTNANAVADGAENANNGRNLMVEDNYGKRVHLILDTANNVVFAELATEESNPGTDPNATPSEITTPGEIGGGDDEEEATPSEPKPKPATSAEIGDFDTGYAYCSNQSQPDEQFAILWKKTLVAIPMTKQKVL